LNRAVFPPRGEERRPFFVSDRSATMNPAVAADSIEKDFTFKRARLGCESRDPTFESKSQIIGRYRNPVLFKSSIRFNCSALHCRSSPRGGMLSDCVRASIRSACWWLPDDWGSSSATPSITCGRKTESPRGVGRRGTGDYLLWHSPRGFPPQSVSCKFTRWVSSQVLMPSAEGTRKPRRLPT
jgi:hypothetical protein